MDLQDRNCPGLVNIAEAIDNQAASIADLTRAVRQLCNPTGKEEQLKCFGNSASSSEKWLYRAYLKDSSQKQDGTLLARNTQWPLPRIDDIAYHFAEFHSDDSNRKRTPLISATSDPINAVKRAFSDRWIHDPSKVIIAVIRSSEFLTGEELIQIATKPPLMYRLSLDSYERLTSAKSQHLYETEAVFVRMIPSRSIKFCITLEELLNRNLLDILPWLNKSGPCSRRTLWPKMIRMDMEATCSTEHQVAKKYTDFFCAATQEGPHVSADSLLKAEELLWGDSRVDEKVKLVCSELFHDRITKFGTSLSSSKSRPIKLSRSAKNTVSPSKGPGFADDD